MATVSTTTTSTKKVYRQAQSVWQCEFRIPDRLIDRVPAALSRTEGMKIPRCAQPQIGGIVDCDDGHQWQIVGIRLFAKKLNNKEKGRMPILILDLIEPA